MFSRCRKLVELRSKKKCTKPIFSSSSFSCSSWSTWETCSSKCTNTLKCLSKFKDPKHCQSPLSPSSSLFDRRQVSVCEKKSFYGFREQSNAAERLNGKLLTLDSCLFIFFVCAMQKQHSTHQDRFQILQNLSQRYPNFYSLWFGVKYFFITDDPAIVQKLLTYPECVEKNFFMELFGFPNGLISLKCKVELSFYFFVSLLLVVSPLPTTMLLASIDT